ncbi:response regulator transcription factor [Halospeciosus flavus]|uniref:Response regulator transcription factor n=1 Tax=Halospeciosus flavus TaxID=3032283 RepID=A0ABD5Z5V5_9EURY|nr:response regulator [Halospeciosus flavus]
MDAAVPVAPRSEFGGSVPRCDGGERVGRGVERPDGVVMVVDDEELTETVQLWLEPHWDVVLAHDGDEAVEEYGPHVDVVLLDRRMPTVSGSTALQRIRSQDGEARVAMMTAVEPDFDIADMEFDMYVRKPVSQNELVESVTELLRRTLYIREVRALFSLGAKLGALQEQYPADDLTEDERYQSLRGEFERLESKAADRLEHLDTDDLEERIVETSSTRDWR